MELKVLFLFLWSCSAPVQSSVIKRLYWYHPTPKKREGAQQFCEVEHGGNLATVEKDADLTVMDLKRFHAWVGVKKVEGSWESETSSPTSHPARKKRALIVEDEEPGMECGKAIYSFSKAYAEKCDQKHFVTCEQDNSKYFFPETMSWDDGLMFCEGQNLRYMKFGENHGQYVNSPIDKQQDFPIWIGLNRKDPALDPAPGSGLCLAISSQSTAMSNKTCSESYPFLCYQNNLVLLKEELSWEDAIESCRSKSLNLLSVEEDELDYVQIYAKGATTRKVWLGLRFLAGSWFWSDDAPLSLSSLPSCPGFHLGCGALVISTNSTSSPTIELIDCSEKLNVFCYESASDQC